MWTDLRRRKVVQWGQAYAPGIRQFPAASEMIRPQGDKQ